MPSFRLAFSQTFVPIHSDIAQPTRLLRQYIDRVFETRGSRRAAPATPALCAAYFFAKKKQKKKKKKKANKYRKPVRMMFSILAQRSTLAPLFCSACTNGFGRLCREMASVRRKSEARTYIDFLQKSCTPVGNSRDVYISIENLST